MSTMLFDLDNERRIQISEAILVFSDSKYLKVRAIGKLGVFYGFLTFIDGVFDLQELQEYGNQYQFFITSNDIVDVAGRIIKNKHIIVIANHFTADCMNYANDNKEVTLIDGLNQQDVANLFKESGDCMAVNKIKCALLFTKEGYAVDSCTLEEVFFKLNTMPNTIDGFDGEKFLNYTSGRPYSLKLDKSSLKFKKDSFGSRYNIAVLDFNVKYSILTLLNDYFNVVVLPFNETFEQIVYLYNDNKIDAVVLPDFMYNTYFIKTQQKNEIQKMLYSKIPVLGIGNGGILMAELLDSTIDVVNKACVMNDFIITNNKKQQFYASNFTYQRITQLSQQLSAKYYDEDANIVGFMNYKNNNLGYTFSISTDSSDMSMFLHNFYKVIRNVQR